MFEEMLRKRGYTITALTDPREALEAFRRKPETFDLLLTDNVMPHLKGVELAAEIKTTHPRFPVLGFSGFSEGITRENCQIYHFDRYLMKPVRLVELCRVLRELLERVAKDTTEAP